MNHGKDPDMAITLFWSPRTRASRAVWLLEEVGVPYERVTIDLGDPDSRKNPDFCRASPMNKVPAMIDGPVAMADSAAMALYLADRYANGRLAPAIDAPDRGRFLFWMFFTPGAIEPAMAEKAGGYTPHRTRNGWGDYETMVATLEDGLRTGPWLLGEHFSAADIMVGATVAFMKQFNLLAENTILDDYARRCTDRPAYQKAQSLEPR